MAKGIKMSPKYGLNPSMTVCYWCGETTGIALMGWIGDGKKREDFEAPKTCFGGYEPCPKCKEIFNQGILVMEASTKPSFPNQPEMQKGIYPTGRHCVVKTEVAERIFNTDATQLFCDKETFDRLSPFFP